MLEQDSIRDIANKAEIIVNGYAFSKNNNELISILNLNHPECAMVINKKCEVIETNMDQIEQKIVLELSFKNIQFLEDSNA